MSFSVTGTANNGYDNVFIKVWVVTGGTESGGAYVCTGGWSNYSFSLTPNASDSVVVAGVVNASDNSPISPVTNNTTDTGSAANYDYYWSGHYTGTVTQDSSITLGCSGSGWGSHAAFEVEPDGTAAIDSSTPAGVQGSTSSASTASFDPPAGSVLVAIVMANGTTTQTLDVSDDSGLGLTWTQQGSTYSAGYTSSIALFTTTLPSGGDDATATPSAVAVSTAINSITFASNATASPSAIALSASVPAPTFVSGTTVSPGVISAAVVIPSITFVSNATAVPSLIDLGAVIPAPTIQASVTVTPSAAALSAAIPAATAIVGVIAQPSVIAVQVGIPAPDMAGDVAESMGAYVGVSGSSQIQGSWSSLANAEGSSTGDYASWTAV